MTEEDQNLEQNLEQIEKHHKLIKHYFPKLYSDKLQIELKLFRTGDWNVDKVLKKNRVNFYYKAHLINDEVKTKFNEMYERYILMIKDIFDPMGILRVKMDKWREHKKNQIFVSEKLVTNNKYGSFSPAYLTKVFNYVHQQTISQEGNPDEIENTFNKCMNEKIEKVKKLRIEYFDRCKLMLDKFVIYHPIGSLRSNNTDEYIKQLVNDIMLEIINYSSELIDLHVYAIPTKLDRLTEEFEIFDNLICDNSNYIVV